MVNVVRFGKQGSKGTAKPSSRVKALRARHNKPNGRRSKGGAEDKNVGSRCGLVLRARSSKAQNKSKARNVRQRGLGCFAPQPPFFSAGFVLASCLVGSVESIAFRRVVGAWWSRRGRKEQMREEGKRPGRRHGGEGGKAEGGPCKRVGKIKGRWRESIPGKVA